MILLVKAATVKRWWPDRNRRGWIEPDGVLGEVDLHKQTAGVGNQKAGEWQNVGPEHREEKALQLDLLRPGNHCSGDP